MNFLAASRSSLIELALKQLKDWLGVGIKTYFKSKRCEEVVPIEPVGHVGRLRLPVGERRTLITFVPSEFSLL